jgi:nucleoside-diphosphate-sugar epimerase
MIVQRMMAGTLPGCPQRWFGIVDVRDLADLHVRAMTNPAARGERFLAAAGDFMPMVDIAKALKSRMGAAAAKVPARQLPNWVVRLAALRDPALRQITAELGRAKNGTNAKARGLLGWKPRSSEEAIVASAESLIRLGLLKDLPQRAA